MVKFRELAEILEKIEKVSSKKLKTSLLANFIKNLNEEEIKITIWFILGNLGEEWKERELDVSFNTLINVFRALGINIKEFMDLYKKFGDPGDAIKYLFEKKSKSSIKPLFFVKKEYEIIDIYNKLKKIESIHGEGSRASKENILKGIFSDISPIEAKLLTRFIVGDMRYGVSEGLLEEVISKAFNIPLEKVQRAHMILGDLGEVVEKILKEGVKSLDNVKIKLFNPIKVMLAEKVDNVYEALLEHDFNTAFEFKFDGIRAQIHKREDIVKIFTRRLKEITESFPDIVELIKENIKAKEVVVEGEIVAWNREEDKPLPFQVLVRRIKREKDIHKMIKEIPVKLFLFDIIYLDGKMLIDLPFIERRKILEKIRGNIELTPILITKNREEAEKFFKKSIEMGNEGLIAKKLDSKYILGKRGKLWLKIKSHLEPLDLVIIAAEWGHGRRRKWLSDYYLATRSEKDGKYYIVGKTFKGLSDREMEELTKELLKIKINEIGRVVWVKPKIVVEVLYDEIQKSPKYECGYALRFARISRIRYDKDVREINTLEDIEKIFKEQEERKKYI